MKVFMECQGSSVYRKFTFEKSDCMVDNGVVIGTHL